MIDIVIPHYGSQALLDRCMEAIRRSSKYPINMLVHDNNRHNIGFAAAVNAAVRGGRAPYIVVLNNDTAVSGDWLSNMMAVLLDDSLIAAVGPISSAPTQWQGTSNVASWLGVTLPTNGYISTIDGPFPSNLAFWCVMIRRETWEHVGSLDEGYFMYGEDDDWCLRARGLGYQFALDLGTIIHHDHRANYDETTRHHHDNSRRRFRTRWGGERADRHWTTRLANSEVHRLPIRLPRRICDR